LEARAGHHGAQPMPTVHLGGAVSCRHGVRSALVNADWVALRCFVMTSPAVRPPVTEAEYLAMERASSIKHELWNGEVFAMTGGTLIHAALGANISSALVSAIGDRKCLVLSSDAKVHVPLTRGFVYPDVSVVCEATQTFDAHHDVLLNPILVVEVLSESTERFDRGDKFAGYRSIPSLVDYVLVSQENRRVEVYTRQDRGGWLLQAYEDGDVALPSLGASLSLDTVYRATALASR
jgi:Uma2 family endonuclease